MTTTHNRTSTELATTPIHVPEESGPNNDMAYSRAQPLSFTFFAAGRELEAITKSHEFTDKELDKLREYGSQDYFPSNCEAYKYHLEVHNPRKRFYKWLLMGIVGCSVGLIAFLVKSCNYRIYSFKLGVMAEYIQRDELLLAFLFFGGIALCLIILSASIVICVEPFAAGSGVPSVMGYLNGVYLPQHFNVRVLIVKFVSCILCVSSSLPLGPEGPMIAMGAVIGYCASRTLRIFNNSKSCRDLVSAGCAAGVGSAFKSPVGGLLFAMEEVSSFWNIQLGWQIFFASMMSVLVASLFLSSFKSFKVIGSFGVFDPRNTSIFHIDLPFAVNIFVYIWAILLGCVGGLLGSMFTFINLKINRFRLHFNGVASLTEVVVCVILWSLISIYVPLLFECKYIERDFADKSELLHLNAYNCHYDEPDVYPSDTFVVYNEAASLLLVSPEHAINNLLRRGAADLFGYGSLLLILLCYFAFAVYLAGSVLACGFVIPMLFIGGLYGRIVGLITLDIFGGLSFDITQDNWSFMDPGVIALLGCASFFAGVSRLTLSLTVIFLEMTNDTALLLPIMATIMVAKWIGDLTTHSLYEALLELQCLPFLQTRVSVSSQYNLERFSVKCIMKPREELQVLHPVMNVNELMQIVNVGRHGIYPVVNKHGKYLGDILARHIHYIFDANVDNGKGLFFENHLDASAHAQESQSVLNVKWKPKIGFEEMDLMRNHPDGDDRCLALKGDQKKYRNYYISLIEYVNTSAFVISQHMSIARAHILFRTMGLRHLTVIDIENEVAGIITRYDLMPVNIETGLEVYNQQLLSRTSTFNK